MHNLLLLGLLTIKTFLVSQDAFAQKNAAPKQSQRELEELGNRSQENRKKITASLGAELYFGYSFVAGYQLNPDINLELWYDKLQYGSIFTPCSGDFEISNYYGARGRYFFGNSFNLSGYTYYKREKISCRTVDVNFIESRGTEPAITIVSRNDRNSSGIGVGFSIGNRWQWENFYLGGEWFGFGVDQVVKNYSQNIPKYALKLVISRLSIGMSF